MNKRVKKIACYCIICNTFIGNHYSYQLIKTCSKKCYKKAFSGINNPNFGNSRFGEDNPNFKNGGETAKKHYCIESECNNEICYDTWKNGSRLCRSCANKKITNHYSKWGKFLTKEFLKKEYLKNKKNTYQIANQIGCSSDTIFYWLKKHKIKIRTKSEALKGRKFTKEHCENIGKSQTGKFGINNNRYIDGRTSLYCLIRALEEYKIWRKSIFERDCYTCQECGDDTGHNLNAHHKKLFVNLFTEFLQEYNQFSPIEDKETLVRLAIKWQSFWNIDDGKTLCEDCHKKEHSKKK